MRFINLAEVWVIEPAAARYYLGVYLGILARKAGITAEGEDARTVIDEPEIGERPRTDNRTPNIRGGVATIPIHGPLVKRGDMFTDVSGLTSVDGIKSQMQAAAADPEVKSILLDIDSPGGQINGVSDLARVIRSASEAKPVVAYSDGAVASGAYWLAAAASEVVLSKTAIGGSIGAMMGWTDDREMKERLGLEDVEFISSQSPLKNVKHDTDAGKAHYQQLVDDAARVFISEVAGYRGVAVATVEKDYGRGGVMVGKRAVKAGLADRIASLDEVHSQLAAGRYQPPKSRAAFAAGGKHMTLADLFRTPLSAFGGNSDDESPEPKQSPDETAHLIEGAQAAMVRANAELKAALTQVQAEAAASNAKLTALGQATLETQASAFAAEHAKKVLPKDREHFEASARELYLKDPQGMTALCEAMPPLTLTQPTIPAGTLKGTRVVEREDASEPTPFDMAAAIVKAGGGNLTPSKNGHAG